MYYLGSFVYKSLGFTFKTGYLHVNKVHTPQLNIVFSSSVSSLSKLKAGFGRCQIGFCDVLTLNNIDRNQLQLSSSVLLQI